MKQQKRQRRKSSPLRGKEYVPRRELPTNRGDELTLSTYRLSNESRRPQGRNLMQRKKRNLKLQNPPKQMTSQQLKSRCQTMRLWMIQKR